MIGLVKILPGHRPPLRQQSLLEQISPSESSLLSAALPSVGVHELKPCQELLNPTEHRRALSSIDKELSRRSRAGCEQSFMFCLVKKRLREENWLGRSWPGAC